MSADTVREPARDLKVINDVDVVVLGGSCTGVFAAVRAARLGAKVAIVEQLGAFGGTATAGFVCIWHSLTDTTYRRQIISGLTEETIERLKAVPNGLRFRPRTDDRWRAPNYSNYILNTEELKIELDRMILEAGVTPYLHTRYSAPYFEDGRLTAVIVENRSGRFAIRAKYFIDATADGFLGADAGMEVYYHGDFQPATAGAKVSGWDRLDHPNALLRTDENRLRIGGRAGWDIGVPGATGTSNWCKTQFAGDCSDADVLTRAEMDGRRQIREMMNILRESDPNGGELSLVALSAMIGIRETRQLRCSYQITEKDICYGRHFDDAIGYCAYPVDVHTPQKQTTFRYLDGWEKHAAPDGSVEEVRWRTDEGPYPTYWEIPLRSITPQNVPNLMICGRCIDADRDAFGALRVMISLNQTGEAAGVACYEALNSGRAVQDIDFRSFREKMREGGSIVI
ncbi:MAG: FAD-dependent oxidoreductase [Clostridia bacterium]|nr:FAD-dependent oxidoreductase [Clostridia bacterium]